MKNMLIILIWLGGTISLWGQPPGLDQIQDGKFPRKISDDLWIWTHEQTVIAGQAFDLCFELLIAKDLQAEKDSILLSQELSKDATILAQELTNENLSESIKMALESNELSEDIVKGLNTLKDNSDKEKVKHKKWINRWQIVGWSSIGINALLIFIISIL